MSHISNLNPLNGCYIDKPDGDIMYTQERIKDEYTEKRINVPRYQNDMGGPTVLELRNTQIGGNHYASLAIQPGEYAMANNLNYWQGNVVKYVTRYKSKGGAQDLDKAIHCLQMLKESEYGRPRDMPKAHSKARI